MQKSSETKSQKQVKKLRIFLSYASEQLAIAEAVDMALTTSGHEVFFDRTDLRYGEFNKAIHEAVRSSDLFVFLISPESISKGNYARTELRYAQAVWRNPIHRVLPVMAVETDLGKVPEYLKGGGILRPEGSLAAEVAAAVNDLSTGIDANETFAEHVKLVRKTADEASRLRRQVQEFEIERDWREQNERYTRTRDAIDLSILGAKGGAIATAIFFCAAAFFMVWFWWGEWWWPGIITLALGAVITVFAYRKGSEYEKAESDYQDRMTDLYAENPDDKPMFRDFTK